MPWRGPSVPGEYPTLGYLVADYIEAACVVPDGDLQGEPYTLTEEMFEFLLRHYRVDPDTGKFVYRGSQLIRPQKWGKGPLSAAMICAEADGPVLFAGWDAAGKPVGRPWASAWIQVTAMSEDQTDNVWRALLPMIELGPMKADVPDTGETRINLPGGGRIEPVTSSARSRLGQRVTFVVQDETHSWTKHNGGRRLADNQRRNLAGMGGRWIETTNAWDPAEESVAQNTFESRSEDVYRDKSDPGTGSIRNKRERAQMLKRVYRNSFWVPLDRIDAEIVDLLPRDPAQAERFFLNRIVATQDAWMDPQLWQQCERAELLADGDRVTLGFDGAKFDDATALVACRVDDGHLEMLGLWESDGSEEWEVDSVAVDAAVAQAYERFNVSRFYADPPYWQDYIDRWAGEFESVVEWWTNRQKAMVAALERFHTAVREGGLSHPSDEDLTRHMLNTRRRETRSGTLIGKDRKGSPRKMDAAMAAVLAYEARADVVAAGALKKKSYRAVGF